MKNIFLFSLSAVSIILGGCAMNINRIVDSSLFKKQKNLFLSLIEKTSKS